MQRHLRTHDVAEWARSFLDELASAPGTPEES
jgi:trehalose 6-phosphate synthase